MINFSNPPLPQQANQVFVINLGKNPQDSKNDSNRDEDEDGEESEKDQLNLQEKIQVTEKIRKLSNEGLAAV